MVALPTHKQFPKAAILQLCQDPIRRLVIFNFNFAPSNTTAKRGCGTAWKGRFSAGYDAFMLILLSFQPSPRTRPSRCLPQRTSSFSPRRQITTPFARRNKSRITLRNYSDCRREPPPRLRLSPLQSYSGTSRICQMNRHRTPRNKRRRRQRKERQISRS